MPTAIDPRHASVSASLTQAVLHAAVRLGLSRDELLAACGLQPEQLADPDGRVAFSAHEHLWQELDTRLTSSEPGLTIGANLAPGPFSVLGYLLQSSATLGDALNAALRYQRLVGEGGELQLETHRDELRVIYRPVHPDLPATRTRVLALMVFWVQMMAPLINHYRLLRAEFTHSEPADTEPYLAAFNAPVLFARNDYVLVLPLELQSAPLIQANPPLQTLLRQHAEALLARLPSEGLVARVVTLLGAQLAHGEPDRAALARTLNLSERTLQRRLADEGSSYQQLLTDTRQQLAERYLDDGQLPAAEIALLLGYSEPSVFFRAFRNWTGLTPGEYRQRART
jgi:AraC-like DNA-binding protein